MGPYHGTEKATRSTRHVSALIIAAQALIYCSSVLESNSTNGVGNALDLEVMAIISIFGITSPYWLAGSHADRFDYTQRVVYAAGVGGSMFSILSAYAVVGIEGGITVWPLAIVFGVPYVVCLGLYSYGKEDALKSIEMGFIPGVLPPELLRGTILVRIPP